MDITNTQFRQKPCSLYFCLRHALWFARCAGFFPVQGLRETSPNNNKFNIKSFYGFYFILSIIGQFALISFSIMYFRDMKIGLITTGNIMFYGSNFVSSFLSLRFAYQWKSLITNAAKTEESLTQVKLSNRVFVKTTAIAYTIMGMGLLEHILCTIFYVNFVMECLYEETINNNVMENYAKFRFPFFYYYVNYNIANAILMHFLCLQSTFLWSFNDVLTICFSIYIIDYFKNLTKVIHNKKNNRNPSWKLLREHYSKLVTLVKEMDSELSSFILVSFICSLFFICLQLFNTLHRNYVYFERCDSIELERARSSPEYLLYFLYSFLFLVMRALTLSLCAANVHCSAMEPVVAVYDVPSSDYDHEVKRFQLQLRYSNIGLTGKFFNVNRNMLLRVIGTIITYELVLLQFSKFPSESSNNSTEAVNQFLNQTPHTNG